MKFMCLADKMKMYENLNKKYLMPNQYVLMRLDGRSFSNFTKKYFKKPFDVNFTSMMFDTMNYLVDNISGCICGYTQSDEITLLLTDKQTKNQEGWFNYRLDKMCSIAASMATAYFNMLFRTYWDNTYCDDKYPYPLFDCRVWQVPNKEEVKNAFLWRQRDCIRNSILQYAYSFFSHNQMMYKNTDELKKMIKDAGYDWDNLDNDIKYGIFYFPKLWDGEEYVKSYYNYKMEDSNLVSAFNTLFNSEYEY